MGMTAGALEMREATLHFAFSKSCSFLALFFSTRYTLMYLTIPDTNNTNEKRQMTSQPVGALSQQPDSQSLE